MKSIIVNFPPFCDLCGKQIPTAAIWEIHIKSKRHLKRVKESSSNESKDSNPSRKTNPKKKKKEIIAVLDLYGPKMELEPNSSLSKTQNTSKRPRPVNSDENKKDQDDLKEPPTKKARVTPSQSPHSDDTEDTEPEMTEAKEPLSETVTAESSQQQKSKNSKSPKTSTPRRIPHFGPKYFSSIRFQQPDDVDLDTEHYLIARNLSRKYCDAMTLKDLFTKILDHECIVDIQLFHNRHHSKSLGFGLFYFKDSSDLTQILEASDEKRLCLESSTASRGFSCALCGVHTPSEAQLEVHRNGKRHREKVEKRKLQKGVSLINPALKIDDDSITMHRPSSSLGEDRNALWSPSEIEELGTDSTLKGKTNLIRISNLHWKCTLRHLDYIFRSLGTECGLKAEDVDPRWLRILEDDKGYPRGVALVMFRSLKVAS